MSEKKEFMAFEFKVDQAESEGDVGYIEGYASTFGNVDLGFDIVEKGAFKKTIKDKKGKFPILLDHMMTKQIGWNIEAEEDDHGLKVKGEIQLVTEEAKNRYRLAKRAVELKTKMGLSIGYSTVKYEVVKDQEPMKPIVRKLKELKLFEYSLVTFPMNEMAAINAAKTANLLHLFELVQKGDYDLDKIKKALELIESQEKSGQAAKPETDPALLIQSVDKLIRNLRVA